MSRLFYTSIDLQRNELQNALLHPLASAPSSPAEGQAYWNTVDKSMYVYDGTTWTTSTHTPVTIASGSTDYLSISGQELSIKALAITNVTVDAVETSLANWVTSYYTGTEFQEGDVVILTSATDPSERRFIHNGGSAGTTSDFTSMDNVLTSSEVRSYISGGTGITYDSGSGTISIDYDTIGAQLAGSGLTYDSGSNVINIDATGYVETFGDGSATSFTITHNLGTNDIITGVYKISTGECMECNVVRTNVNTLSIGAFPAPALNDARIMVQKVLV